MHALQLPGGHGPLNYDTHADLEAAVTALAAAQAAGEEWRAPMDPAQRTAAGGEWVVLPGGAVLRIDSDPDEAPPAPE